MSRKTVQRFCGDDMRENNDLKRGEQIPGIATRFDRPSGADRRNQSPDSPALIPCSVAG
jgi:hypothetical protein